MAKIFTLVLLLLNTLGMISGIRLDGNGYTDIVIAINPAVPENEALIDQIKGMITNGSEYLLQALDKKVYIKEVKILVPPNWRGTYERARRETYDKANIIIDYPNPAFGNDPYTKQLKGCGEESDYIHLTQEFLLNDTLVKVYGPRGRVFVHQWAHLRWGVFDEYNENEPFYFSSTKEIQPTRCSGEITGQRYKLMNGDTLSCREDENGLPTKECQFFPDKNQKTNASIMFMQSLDSVKAFCHENEHNTEAPNMQNQKCDGKATRTVIFQDSVDRDALKTLSPLQTPPPPPLFKIIQRSGRVVCLILDVSGSMQGKERILRLQQAATLFLSDIVEEGAYVGMVKFSTHASIISPLTKIQGKASRDSLIRNLPTTAAGKTNMCNGLRLGFEVLQQDDKSAVGDYVIFLTDGEATDNIQDCLQLAVDSGAIINTIALGQNASNVLITMANLTGGTFQTADENLLFNQLVDVFSSFTTSDGDLTKQTFQLVSTGMITADWFNGTVPVDRTVGNSTTFTIIYEKSPPTVYIQTPSGSVYSQIHVTNNAATKTVTLNIPGTAETGDWEYSFLSKEPSTQAMTLTVTSQAANNDVRPVVVKAQMNQLSSDGSKPMVVYADVSQNYLPVLEAKVIATLQSDTGHPVDLYLLDNGAGADHLKDDGIYSRYFTNLTTGRYSLKVQVISQDRAPKHSPKKHSCAVYVPGYIEDGKVQLNPQKPSVSVQSADVGNFSRTATGESFVVSVPPGVPSPNFPPNKITDLSAEIQGDSVLLNWTAPGEDYDQGTAKFYEIRWSYHLEMLKRNFSNAYPVNTSTLQPQEAGSAEHYSFLFETTIPNGTILFFAVRSEDKEAMKSEVSNIAQGTKFVPSPKPPEISKPGLNLIAIVFLVLGVIILPCIIVCIAICVLRRKNKVKEDTENLVDMNM
ncbi:calcium-activated chloride channel regulator 4A-like isoform X2 [Hoplias malabaricus]|uniref:calcium-activated chloride channel regulator 4A-like isoform X2 n=1 Tax=Hoplias malabaricus TaxID=27720 RepID=UPI00346358E7